MVNIFTGIIEDIGVIKGIKRQQNSMILNIKTDLTENLEIGGSISVNGPCLTVIEKNERHKIFKAEVMPETYRKTNLKNIKAKDKVNLETSLTLKDKIGGHLVTGHIDGLGKIKKIQRKENARIFTIKPPKNLLKYITKKGSISVDGISLTVSNVDHNFSVSVTNFTYDNTVLKEKKIGNKVNLEVDLLARYLESLNKKNKDEKGNLLEKLGRMEDNDD